MRTALLLLACAVPAWAGKSNNGLTTVPILGEPLGGRAVGLAGAYEASGDDLFSVAFNPGGLASIKGGEFGGLYHRGLEGGSAQFAGLALSLPVEALPGQRGGTVMAISALFSQAGTIEVNRTNSDGSFLSSETIEAGSDLVLGLSFSQRLHESIKRRGDGEESRTIHQAGFTLKHVQSTLAETYTARVFAGDIGYVVRMPETGLDIGLSAMNLGGKLRFVTEGDPLPTSYRAGAAYKIKLAWGPTLTLMGSGQYRAFEKTRLFAAGAEYGVGSSYYVRGGYRFAQDTGGPTLGLGLRSGSLQLDLGLEVNNTFQTQHRLNLLWRFRPPWAKPEKRKRLFIEDLDMPRKIDDKPVSPREERERAPAEHGVPGWIY